MAREIKFRAWDKQTGLFLPPEAVDALIDGNKVAGRMPPVTQTEVVEKEVQTGSYDGLIVKNIPIYSCYNEAVTTKTEQPIEVLQGNPFTMERLELMQFTGLKDKNGVEIYQGDILRLNNDNYDPGYEGFYEGIAEVTSKTCGFGLKPIPDLKEPNFYDGSIFWHVGEGDTTEVIGSIYQSPELLKNNGDTK